MTSEIHNFIPAHEVLEAAVHYHERAASLCDSWSKTAGDERARTFLSLVARTERETAAAFHSHVEAHTDLTSLDTWFQNAPEDLPRLEDLDPLEARLGDIDAFCADLLAVHRRWMAIYQAFEAESSIDKVRELFASCRALLLSKQQVLSSAQVQLSDM